MATLFIIGAIFFFSSLVQGFTGFGSALVAIPLLCLVVDIKFAIPLTVLNSLVITSFLAVKMKTHLNKTMLLPLCLATLPGIVAGVTLLKQINSNSIALLMGILLLAYSLYSLFGKPRKKNLHHGWAYLAGFLSGAIGAAFSAGGPPVIIYTTLTGWSKDHIKATLTGFFLFNSLMVALAHAATGLTNQAVVQAFLLSSPFTFAGTITGSYFYGYLARETYVKFIYVFLIILAIMLITIKV